MRKGLQLSSLFYLFMVSRPAHPHRQYTGCHSPGSLAGTGNRTAGLFFAGSQLRLAQVVDIRYLYIYLLFAADFTFAAKLLIISRYYLSIDLFNICIENICCMTCCKSVSL